MSKKENLNIALFQQNIVWEDPEANFSKVEKAFADFAAALGDGAQMPDILVVPETFSTGFGDQMARQAEAPFGPVYDFALTMARRYDALFAGTWTVPSGSVDFSLKTSGKGLTLANMP